MSVRDSVACWAMLQVIARCVLSLTVFLFVSCAQSSSNVPRQSAASSNAQRQSAAIANDQRQSAAIVPDPQAQQIDQEVANIIAGEHGMLPPAQAVQVDPQAETAQVQLQNDTAYTLTVLYSGPTSRKAVLAPSTQEEIVLGVGDYKVAAKVSEASVIPFAGNENLQGGRYSNTFYIQTRSQ